MTVNSHLGQKLLFVLIWAVFEELQKRGETQKATKIIRSLEINGIKRL